MDFEVIRKKTIEVKIVDDNAVVLIETDNNGQFINAKAFDLVHIFLNTMTYYY